MLTRMIATPHAHCRMHYALETHGVRAVRMAPTPTAAQLKPPQPLLSGSAGAFIVKWSPYVLVGLVYLATSYVRWKKVCGLLAVSYTVLL